MWFFVILIQGLKQLSKKFLASYEHAFRKIY